MLHETHAHTDFGGLPLEMVHAIEESYERLDARPSVATMFYDELFRIRPSLRSCFPRMDLAQRDVTRSFIGFVIANLRSPVQLRKLLERMGERGMLVGISRDDVNAIGRALLLTLRDLEGERWTRDLAHAWAMGFTWVVSAIRRGALSRASLPPG